MGDVLVRVLANSRFSGVESGGYGSQPHRVWWNGRLDSWHSMKPEAERRYAEIKKRGWA